jgi:hypothetical protein
MRHYDVNGDGGEYRVLRSTQTHCGLTNREETKGTQQGFPGGGDGIRTHCLYIANVALYQLSYTPEEVSSLT